MFWSAAIFSDKKNFTGPLSQMTLVEKRDHLSRIMRISSCPVFNLMYPPFHPIHVPVPHLTRVMHLTAVLPSLYESLLCTLFTGLYPQMSLHCSRCTLQCRLPSLYLPMYSTLYLLLLNFKRAAHKVQEDKAPAAPR